MDNLQDKEKYPHLTEMRFFHMQTSSPKLHFYHVCNHPQQNKLNHLPHF